MYVFMKITNKKIQYILSIGILVLICRLFLQIDNIIVQSMGLAVLPFIIVYSILLVRIEQKQIKKQQ